MEPTISLSTNPSRARAAGRSRLDQVALGLLLVLALTLPFEAELIVAGPLRVTNLEIVLALLLPLAFVSFVRNPSRPRPGWRVWAILGVAFALGLLLPALLAPELRLNALKASVRVLSGLLLAAVTPLLLQRQRDFLLVVGALLLGGAVAAAAGLLEVTRGLPLPWLTPFRPVPTSAGPFLRLTAAFTHANQAAMYLSATLPLWGAVAYHAWQRRRWSWLALAAAGALLFLQAIVLTYSRTSLVTVFASNVAVALFVGWRRRGRGRQLALPWAALAGALLVLVAVNTLRDPVLQLRLTSQDDGGWYRVAYDVPDRLEIGAGESLTTTVRVANQGALTWAPAGENRVALSGRWIEQGSGRQLPGEPRWTLDAAVEPGENAQFSAVLVAPRTAGAYRFQWDLVHEDVTWFSFKNGERVSTAVVVRGNDVPAPADEAAPSEPTVAVPDIAPIPGRLTLWRIAVDLVQRNPVFGIGLDNFRLVYGRALDYARWNETIHTNNWYLEMLVSLGVVGALPFFAGVVYLALQLGRGLRRRSVTPWQIALAAGIVAFFLHGLLDFFLLFNGTGLLFWLLLGLWLAKAAGPPTEAGREPTP